MRYPTSLPAFFLAVTVLFAAGCTHHRQYRRDLVACDTTLPTPPCTEAAIEITPDYKLGFVEFDDQGWFWERTQFDVVKEMLRAEASVGRSNVTQGVIMVLFVHGWKNNAAFDNENVAMFRRTLRELERAERALANTNATHPRKVVGVYAGWRGLSAKWEPFKELSFWERKNTAHKIGHGAMTQLLADLENIQTASNRAIGPDGPRTEFIIMGHSFGGAAVYSAISQIITERFVDTVERGRPLKPLGDVVILLNPAFEASRHYSLNERASLIQRFPPSQLPVLAIFTSRGDWATRYAFPIGRYFSTMFEKARRDPPQGKANRSAVGWFKPFINYDLVYDANATNSPTTAIRQSTYNRKTKAHEYHREGRMEKSVENTSVQQEKWKRETPEPIEFSFDDCVLKPRAGFKPGYPFLIVSVDKKIMSGHGDLANPVLINFLREFIVFCQPQPRRVSK